VGNDTKRVETARDRAVRLWRDAGFVTVGGVGNTELPGDDSRVIESMRLFVASDMKLKDLNTYLHPNVWPRFYNRAKAIRAKPPVTITTAAELERQQQEQQQQAEQRERERVQALEREFKGWYRHKPEIDPAWPEVVKKWMGESMLLVRGGEKVLAVPSHSMVEGLVNRYFPHMKSDLSGCRVVVWKGVGA